MRGASIPAGHEYAVKDNEIAEISPPGEGFNQLYVDEKFKVADPPGRDPGGIIAWEYEKREHPYVAEADWFFQDDLPRVNQSFNLVLPEGYTYTTTWAHHPKLEAIDLEHQKYRWEMNNEPAIDLERVPMSPSTESLAGRMTVHYAGPGLAFPEDGTWKGVGQWYAAISHDRLASTPEIAAKAAELTAGKTDFYDKAEAIGGVRAGADPVLRCRERDRRLPAALCRPTSSATGTATARTSPRCCRPCSPRSGFTATSCWWIRDAGLSIPNDPSRLGDHAIAAIEIPKGYSSPKLHSVVSLANGKRYLIYDPTWEETPFGQD